MPTTTSSTRSSSYGASCANLIAIPALVLAALSFTQLQRHIHNHPELDEVRHDVAAALMPELTDIAVPPSPSTVWTTSTPTANGTTTAPSGFITVVRSDDTSSTSAPPATHSTQNPSSAGDT